MKNNKILFTHFLGIDVAKSWLDLALTNDSGKILAEHRVKNTAKSLNARFKKWQIQFGFTPDAVLICAENTGLYTNPLLNFALENSTIQLWVEHAAKIAQCTGPVRAVNDQLAAQRIANYARRYADSFKQWKPKAQHIERLKNLAVMRKRLINMRKQAIVPFNELRTFNPKLAKDIQNATQSVVKEFDKQINTINEQIDSLLAEDPELKRQSEILQSIPGIGRVTALIVLVATQQFNRFDNAKQFACFCGIAPFDQTSGSSVRKRPRVSHKADKQLKELLHLAALSAIRADPELKAYYSRKVQQGKNKMSMVNAVRNKLIHRMFSLIKRNETFKTKENFGSAA